MAVDDTTDTGADSVDTSTNEGTSETDAEAELENLSWDDGEGEETEDADESKAEDDSAKSDDDETEDESDDDVVEKSEQSDDTTQQKPESKPVDEKEQARVAFQQRQAEKMAKEQQKRDAQAEYLQAAEDERDLALRQLQIDAYSNRIQSNTDRLTNSLDKAVANIELFQTGTPAVKERLLRALDQYEALYVRKDANGDPIEVNGDMFEYLQQEANSIKELLGDGARQQDKSKANQKARTTTTPVRAPKKAKVDADLDAFDEVANRTY